MRILFHCALLVPLALEAQAPLERLFYYVDREDSYESFVKHADRIDILGVGGYRVDSLGILWGSIDRRVLDLARLRNVKVMPLLVNENFHQPTELAGPLSYHRFLFDSWRAAYDLAALARLSDFVTIMTYSQHTRRTTPGPQAGIPWMRSVVDYVLKAVPAEKLSLGIPSQGLHFFTRED